MLLTSCCVLVRHDMHVPSDLFRNAASVPKDSHLYGEACKYRQDFESIGNSKRHVQGNPDTW